MKVLVVSNGHGEDQIAAKLTRALCDEIPKIRPTCAPLVLEGHAYSQYGFTTTWTNPSFPSGGFIRSIWDVIADIRAGLLRHIWQQRTQLKRLAKSADLVIAVGDVFCLLMAGTNTACPVIFLPTAKSDTFMPHSAIEKWVIRRWATMTYTRDEATSEALNEYGLRTRYLGNPMFDDLDIGDDPFEFKDTDQVITLIPGSRDEAYTNLVPMLQILAELGQDDPKIKAILAKSPNLDLNQMATGIKALGWTLSEDGTRFGHTVHPTPLIVTEKFAAAIQRADVCIGLAGTANEQAVHIGKPVVCFPGTGPQTTATRFREQSKLLGEQLHFVDDQGIGNIAEVCRQILDTRVVAGGTASSHASSEIAKDIVAHIGAQ